MAQLVAHLHGMQGVRGSSPLSSTQHRSRLRAAFCISAPGAAGSGSVGRACRGSGVRVPSAPPNTEAAFGRLSAFLRRGAAGSGSVGRACRGSGVRVPSAPPNTEAAFGRLSAFLRVAQLVAALWGRACRGSGVRVPSAPPNTEAAFGRLSAFSRAGRGWKRLRTACLAGRSLASVKSSHEVLGQGGGFACIRPFEASIPFLHGIAGAFVSRRSLRSAGSGDRSR